MASRKVVDVMTPAPTSTDVSETLLSTARTMAAQDVGTVLVSSGPKLVGIVTDRDLAVERDPTSALADISDAEPNR